MILINKVYKALTLPILLYGSEICTLRKKDKKDWHQLKWNFSEEQQGTHFFDHKRNTGRTDSRTSRREIRKRQIKLATTCNKNEQQQAAKNNAELQTNWRKRLGRPLKRLLCFADRAFYYSLCKWPTWGRILLLIFVYSNSLHVSSNQVLIIRRINCINTTENQLYQYNWLFWWWALGCSKHVENSNKQI